MSTSGRRNGDALAQSPNGAVLATVHDHSNIVDNERCATTNPLDNADSAYLLINTNSFPQSARTRPALISGRQITQMRRSDVHQQQAYRCFEALFRVEYQQTAAYVFRIYRAALVKSTFSESDPANPVEAA